MGPLDGLVLAGGRGWGRGRRGGARAVDRPDGYEGLALPARLVADESPGLGPLSGLQVGLRTCRTEHVLVAASDLPFLNVELLRHMARLPRSYQALVPRRGGGWEAPPR